MARRVFIFSIGFLMGCVLVYNTFFKDSERDFYGSWLPEGRVLKKINQSLDHSSTRYQCQIKSAGIFESEMDKTFADGSVDFDNSETKGEPKSYRVSHEIDDNRILVFDFALREDTAWIIQLGVNQFKETNCD
jgi:hypothetical protein